MEGVKSRRLLDPLNHFPGAPGRRRRRWFLRRVPSWSSARAVGRPFPPSAAFSFDDASSKQGSSIAPIADPQTQAILVCGRGSSERSLHANTTSRSIWRAALTTRCMAFNSIGRPAGPGRHHAVDARAARHTGAGGPTNPCARAFPQPHARAPPTAAPSRLLPRIDRWLASFF